MNQEPVPLTVEQAAARRRAVRRTALVLACIAAAFFIGFIVRGVSQ